MRTRGVFMAGLLLFFGAARVEAGQPAPRPASCSYLTNCSFQSASMVGHAVGSPNAAGLIQVLLGSGGGPLNEHSISCTSEGSSASATLTDQYGGEHTLEYVPTTPHDFIGYLDGQLVCCH